MEKLTFLMLATGDGTTWAFNMDHVQAMRPHIERNLRDEIGYTGTDMLLTSGTSVWVKDSIGEIFDRMEALCVKLRYPDPTVGPEAEHEYHREIERKLLLEHQFPQSQCEDCNPLHGSTPVCKIHKD